MSKIKILAISPDNFGVGKYRILDPYKYIAENYGSEFHVDVVYDVPNDNNQFRNYDIVIFHSFIHKINHEVNLNRITWLKQQGIKTIMDVDDYWTVDPRHPLFKQIQKNDFVRKKIELLKAADYITTTTPFYRNSLIKKLGVKNVMIFPNAINHYDQQFQPKPIPSKYTRFGWLGGSSHLHDIKLLENGINMIHQNHNGEVQFVLCGFDLRGTINEINKETGQVKKRPIKPKETVWYEYEKIFTKNYTTLSPNFKQHLNLFIEGDIDPNIWDEPYIRRWTKPIQNYGINYNYFDVSLAPLVDTDFNRNKSNLKAIESGFHKKALIASDVYPYKIDLEHGKNALLVNPNKNHKEWFKHMKTLLKNPNMIKDLGEALYETVSDNFSLQKVTKDRIEFFKTIVNN
jgi:glycosyltransferase involved in cell wall biosynthesis